MIPFEDSKYIYINDIPIKSFKFSGGEIQVKVPDEIFKTLDKVTIYSPIVFRDISVPVVTVKAFLLNSDAIMELLLITDALKNEHIFINILLVPYFPYARQDRVCVEGEAFSLSVITRLLIDKVFTSIGRKIITYDIHSDKISTLLEKTDVNFKNIIPSHLFKTLNQEYDYIIAPDKGSKERAENFSKVLETPIVYASKVRDATTGYIISSEVNLPSQAKKVLIVDDICDGGFTFVKLARIIKHESFRNGGDNVQIDLFVTHGIFSKGFDVFDELIENIYYLNTRNQDGSGNPNVIHIVNCG
jgi:ribose-phosphate pyrophosphokinase